MENREEQIIKYIQGELVGEELALFEGQLLSDQKLAKEVAELALLENHIQSREPIHHSLEILINVHEEIADEGIIDDDPLQKPIWGPIILVLMMIGLVLMGIYYVSSSQNEIISKEIIYANYFDPDHASFQTKGNTIEEILLKAQLLFNQERYQESVTQFESYLSETEDAQLVVRFYYGIALIGANQNEKGRETLQNLISKESLYRNEARYYIGLSFIQEDDLPAASMWLKQIEKSSSKYALSQEILNKL